MQQAVHGRRRFPRRFQTHRTRMGNTFRVHFEALEAQLGPFTTELQRQACADVAAYHAIKQVAMETWDTLQRARAEGKGRRPSMSEVIRAAKRVALESRSYERAYARLTQLVSTPHNGHDQLLAQYTKGHQA